MLLTIMPSKVVAYHVVFSFLGYRLHAPTIRLFCTIINMICSFFYQSFTGALKLMADISPIFRNIVSSM